MCVCVSAKLFHLQTFVIFHSLTLFYFHAHKFLYICDVATKRQERIFFFHFHDQLTKHYNLAILSSCHQRNYCKEFLYEIINLHTVFICMYMSDGKDEKNNV